MIMKMWCLCTKKTGRPIKIKAKSAYYGYNEIEAIGFARRQDVLDSIANSPEHDEVVRRIDFEY